MNVFALDLEDERAKQKMAIVTAISYGLWAI